MNQKLKNNFIIEKESQGKRLDKFLTEELEISRSQIKKIIKAEQVLVNNKPATVHRFLKVGDKIEIQDSKLPIPTKIQLLKTATTGLFKAIKVVAEKDDFIIIEKPAGLLVHPTDKNETDTLVEWLVKKYPELVKLGEDPGRAAIVHRLDKDVSGLMLIPRTQDAFDYFKKLFQQRTLTKRYIALVYGEIEKNADEITLPIGRSKTKPGTFAARSKKLTAKDRTAITRFKVKQRFKNHTLLEVEILTGRTHQIRVHMMAYGHPIVGDKLYQNKKHKKSAIDRIFLHAGFLSFIDLAGATQEFDSQLPNSLQSFLSGL